MESGSTETDFRKKTGVNCYSFAIGRIPKPTINNATLTDPIPGGLFIETLRLKCIDTLTSTGTSSVVSEYKFNKKFRFASSCRNLKLLFLAQQDKDVNFNFTNLLKETSGRLKTEAEKEQLLFFQKTFKETDLVTFLTDNYKIPYEYMQPEIIRGLLIMDGLIPVTKDLNSTQCDFGDLLIAAFVYDKQDYHFARLFSDGWYERNADKYIKLDQPIEGKEEGFIDFFIVPTTVSVVDEIGRKFIFESLQT